MQDVKSFRSGKDCVIFDLGKRRSTSTLDLSKLSTEDTVKPTKVPVAAVLFAIQNYIAYLAEERKNAHTPRPLSKEPSSAGSISISIV
jgi:hypothetical protein